MPFTAALAQVVPRMSIGKPFLVVAAAMITGGCVQSESATELGNGVSETSTVRSDADREWLVLTSPPANAVTSRDATQRLARFSKSLELQRQSFRQRGLSFWRRFPNDERRFDWLIITTYLEPFYPADIDAWSQAETDLGPNLSDKNTAARNAWLEVYKTLREEFLQNEGVSELRRRQLGAAEIINTHRYTRYRFQREGIVPDEEASFNTMIEFLRDFPEPLSDNDSEPANYAFDRDRVLAPVLGWADSGYSIEAAARFRSRMQEEGIEWYDAYARITSDDRYRSRVIRENLDAHHSLRTYDDTQSTFEWSDMRDSSRQNDRVLYALYASSYNFPSRNISHFDDVVDTATDYADIHISLARFRELGLLHFDRMPRNHQIHWLLETTARSPFGVNNIVNYMFDPPSDFRLGPETLLDIDWLRASEADVRQRFDQLINDRKTSDSTRRTLRAARAKLGTVSAAYLWTMRGERHAVEEKLLEIRDLDTTHGQSGDAARLVRSFLRPGNQSYLWYGLTETALAAFLEPFLVKGGDEMRAVAEAYLERVKLEPGMSVSIQAPTLEGDETVSTKDFDGRILLVDNWDTNCAPCIAAFPNIQEILEDYSEHGFEIMSIAYDGGSQRAAIERIKERLGLSWSTLNGEGLWPAVSSRYGLSGYPQYMLLDRQGRYVAGNSEIDGTRNLRALLDELLAKDRTDYYSQRPAMWRVEDNDTIMYLYGTIHSVKPHFDWLTEDVDAIVQGADIVYFETPHDVSLSPEERARFQQVFLRNPDDVKLSSLMTEDEAEELRLAVQALGLDWYEIQTYSPDAAAAAIGSARRVAAGAREGEGAESHIVRILRGGKDEQQRSFATFEQQYRYMSEMSQAGQVAYLMSVVRDESGDDYDKLFAAWRTGDLETLERLAVSEPKTQIPEAYDTMIASRNRAWVDELTRVMNEERGVVFVAVGAGHLVGADSLQSLLAQEGFESERVQ